MKKIYMLGFALALFGLVSCSENQLDSINKDEAHSGVDIVNAKFQITEAETSTVYSLLCGNYAWYVSSYTEQLFGTGNNQLKNVELRHASELAGSSVFNNEWNSTYTSLNNIVNIRKKATDGINAGQSDVMGMAEVLEAINWGVLTDLHGDIPYSEAFGEVAAPKIDSQKMYMTIFLVCLMMLLLIWLRVVLKLVLKIFFLVVRLRNGWAWLTQLRLATCSIPMV